MKYKTHKFFGNRKLLILSTILCVLLFGFSTQTFAVDFTVNLTTDQPDANFADQVCDIDLAAAGEQCSLRAAVKQAERLETVDTNVRILFGLPAKSTIILTDEIRIETDKTLEIIGSGADNLIIDGGAGSNRIFTIEHSRVPVSPVTISGVTLTGGKGDFGGGAIEAFRSLTLDRVHVTNNSASGGGGGLYFGRRANGQFRIINSTISSNKAQSCGGIRNDSNGILTITNSTISGNIANSPNPNNVERGIGGGICSNGYTFLRNVTVTKNVADGDGSGIFDFANNMNIGNSVIAGNTSINSRNFEISAFLLHNTPGITSAGGNVIGGSPGSSINPCNGVFNHSTDKCNVDPVLGALANNGGETPTHALLAGSPLIDAGDNNLAVDPATFNPQLAFDQRGAPFARIADGNGDGTAVVDIGAFEAQLVIPRRRRSRGRDLFSIGQ